MGGLQKLLDEQARAYICGKLGHSRRFILPVQKRDESREIFSICKECNEEAWIELPQKGYEKFLKDLADGKIK